MIEGPLQVDGKQSDYNLQMVSTDAGQMPVLVGVAGQAFGQVHHLAGARAIQFQDGLVDLLQTPLALSPDEASVARVSTSGPRDANAPSRLDSADTDAASETDQAIDATGVGNPVSPAQYVGLPPTAAELLAESNEAELETAESPSEPSIKPQPTDGQSNASPPAPPKPPANGDSSTTSAVTDLTSLVSALPALQPAMIPTSGVGLSSAPALREIFGTPGPDRLIGTSGADRIDGLANFDLVDGSFNEVLMGMDGNDFLFYRGFFGDFDGFKGFDADSTIQAALLGGAGDDQLNVSLDQTTDISVDGGSGIDHLVLQSMQSSFDPWSAQHMFWAWDFTGLGPTLTGQYNNPLHSNARITETSPSVELISTASGSPMQLIRPSSEQATSLDGSPLSDLLIASDATGRIQAGAGNDVVLAQQGNIVELGQGINTLYSADPDMTLSYAESPYGVDADLSKRLGIVFDATDDIYSIDRLQTAVKHLSGSANNDRLVGDSQDNIIRTGGGSDLVVGGAGADHFILDIDADAGATSIQDFSLEQGDSLSLNLSALDLSAMGLADEEPFFSYLISDEAGNTVHQGLVNQTAVEEGAILQLQLQDQDSTLYWARPDDSLNPLVDLHSDLNQFDEDQWNQFLSVDHL